MRKFAHHFSVLGIAMFLVVSAAWAQQNQNQQQTQSGQQKGQKTGTKNASSPESPQQPLSQGQAGPQQTGTTPAGEVQTAAPPLTGAEEYTLSTLGAGHSYVVPMFQVGQSVSTTGTGAFGKSTLYPVTTVSGLFAFHHLWSRYEFTAQYAGSGFIYDQQPSLNSSAHQFFFTQRVIGRRSTFQLSDAVSYLPQASFGYARLPGLNNFGAGGYGFAGLYGGAGNLDTTFLPNQSVLTVGSRIGNSVIGEYDYQTSRLSSLTFTGSYALIRFPNSPILLESDAGIFRVGYNHTFTRKSSMGVAYQGGIFRYGSSTGDFSDHVVTVRYRRTLSNRLAMQVGAGPQVNVFNSTLSGQNTHVTWQASALLNYRLKRASVGLSYHHYTSSGSGVYYGAQTDNVGFYFATALSQMWSMNADTGYAYNKSLQNASGNKYNSWYGFVNFNRNLNRSTAIFFGYNLQQQLSSAPTSVGSTRGTFYTEQYFSVGLSWHPNVSGYEQP